MSAASEDLVLCHGGCHCGRVRYEVETTATVDVYNCKYVHIILIPKVAKPLQYFPRGFYIAVFSKRVLYIS